MFQTFPGYLEDYLVLFAQQSCCDKLSLWPRYICNLWLFSFANGHKRDSAGESLPSRARCAQVREALQQVTTLVDAIRATCDPTSSDRVLSCDGCVRRLLASIDAELFDRCAPQLCVHPANVQASRFQPVAMT